MSENQNPSHQESTSCLKCILSIQFLLQWMFSCVCYVIKGRISHLMWHKTFGWTQIAQAKKSSISNQNRCLSFSYPACYAELKLLSDSVTFIFFYWIRVLWWASSIVCNFNTKSDVFAVVSSSLSMHFELFKLYVSITSELVMQWDWSNLICNLQIHSYIKFSYLWSTTPSTSLHFGTFCGMQ